MAEGITLTHGIAGAVGAVIVAAGRVLFGHLIGAKDKQITVLEAEVERLHGVVKALGDKADAIRDEKDKELRAAYARMATAVYKGRKEADVPEDFEEECPTAVRNILDVVSSRRPGTSSTRDASPVDRFLKRADERPLERWDDGSTPPGSPEPPRPRMPSRPR